MARKTVFDDVFRTICQKMPYLLIPIINEVFGTEYQEDTPITQLRNERHEISGVIITDALIRIQNHTYHIECQSKDDNSMVIRMIEYDFFIALEQLTKETDNEFNIKFPESCVIYLRESSSPSRAGKVNVEFHNGEIVTYAMRSVCVQDYSENDMFQKKLLMFLPFYALRHEKEISGLRAADTSRLEKLLQEYEGLFLQLEKSCVDNAGMYTDLYNLSIKIINYLAKSNTVRRRFQEMGGKILELQSEKLRAEGGAEERVNAVVNMIELGLTKEQILTKYSASEYEEAEARLLVHA